MNDIKISLAIISDDILFWNLFIPLLVLNSPAMEIQICTTYAEINKKFQESKYNLILIDGGISSFSSIEVIQYIRMRKLVIAPIWFFPEIQSDSYFYKAKEMGVTRLIIKPFDPYLIVNEIKNLFNK